MQLSVYHPRPTEEGTPIMTKRFIKKAPGATESSQQRASVQALVADVIADVRERGDAAVREYSEKFDQWSPEQFKLTLEDRRHGAHSDHRRHPGGPGASPTLC
jgi:histidinol dehydrogenase